MNFPDLTCSAAQCSAVQCSAVQHPSPHLRPCCGSWCWGAPPNDPTQERPQSKMRSHRRGHAETAPEHVVKTPTGRCLVAWLHAADRRPQTVRCCLSLPVPLPLPLEQNPRAAGSGFSAVFNSGWSARQTELSCLVGRIANQPSPPLRFNRFKARLLPESQDFHSSLCPSSPTVRLRLRLRPTTTRSPRSFSFLLLPFDFDSSCDRGRRILLSCYYVLINRRSLIFLCSSAAGIPSGRRNFATFLLAR
jgi:hypothetical protein